MKKIANGAQTTIAKMTLAQIKKKYTNKWVGLANPEYEKDGFTLKEAYALCGSKNRGLAYKKLDAFDDGKYKVFKVMWVGEPLEKHFDPLVFKIIENPTK